MLVIDEYVELTDELSESKFKIEVIENELEAITDNTDVQNIVQHLKLKTKNSNEKEQTPQYTKKQDNVKKKQDHFVNAEITVEESYNPDSNVPENVPFCEELFVYLVNEDLQKLQLRCNKKQPLKSDSCADKSIKEKIWSTNGPQKFYCMLCTLEMGSKYDRRIHIWKEHRKYAIENNYVPAENMVMGENPAVLLYRCTTCSYISNQKTSLTRHLLIHKSYDETEVFRCADCPYITKFKCCLIEHMFIHRNDDSKFIPCPHCKYKSRNKSYLNKHIQKFHNSGEFPVFKCRKCSFQTFWKTSMKRHKLQHQKEEKEVFKHKCGLCPYSTEHRRYLKLHCKNEHKKLNKKYKFSCDLCPYKAKSEKYFKKHKLSHTQSVIHECPDCPYKSIVKQRLEFHFKRKHKRLDETEYFRCYNCEYKSITKYALQCHWNYVHKNPDEITWYKCDKCDYKSKTKSALNKHSKTFLRNHKPSKEES